MLGAAMRARLNASLSAASPSPTYMLYSCAQERDMKVAPEAVAAARASVVLLQPGGPCSSTPRGGERPSLWNASAARTATSSQLAVREQ